MNAFALARWYTKAREAEEFEREELIGKLYDFTAWGEVNKNLILKTKEGACVISINGGGQGTWPETIPPGSCIVDFEIVKNRMWDKVHFWFNYSSVQDLIQKIRTATDKKVPFDRLFTHGR
jgi:hypothetical protein